MRETENELDELTRIQQELDSMAADVPEMTREFRQGWRRAIREEAAKRAEEAGTPENEEYTEPGYEMLDREETDSAETGEKRIRVLRTRRWTGILSAAAAMIFLIGGTLATRNTLSPRLRTVKTAILQHAGSDPGSEMPAPATAMPTGTVNMEAGAGEAAMGISQEKTEGADSAFTNDAAYLTAADSDKGVRSEDAGGTIAGKTRGFTLQMSGAAQEEEASEEADSFDSEEKIQELVYAEEPAETEETADEEESVPAAVEQTDFRTEVLFFLEDMVAFLKAALPYPAGIAAATVVVLLIRKQKRK